MWWLSLVCMLWPWTRYFLSHLINECGRQLFSIYNRNYNFWNGGNCWGKRIRYCIIPLLPYFTTLGQWNTQICHSITLHQVFFVGHRKHFKGLTCVVSILVCLSCRPYLINTITGVPSSNLKKKQMINSWKPRALCDSVLSYDRNHWEFEHVIRTSMGNKIWSIYNNKYFRIWTFYT